MNAFMNVQVRILTLEARQQIRQLEAELRRFKRSVNSGGMERAAAGTDRLAGATSRYAASTNAAIAGTNRMTTSFGRAMTAGTKFGNQLQWTGRQLQYNFAMPIALGAAYATSAALKHEAAMTRIQKVYGDGTQTAQVYNEELKAMERLITALSNKFGVAREEVGAIAADWAAAGAEAGALARAVNLTMETMVLGEIEAATATKALIAIQAQYGADTKQLTKIIGDLNMVENETGTTMNDLIMAMSRAASVARTASVDHRHLAAMTAALVPAAGSATQAGNGLKTMITRLMAPTNQAADAMEKMGIKIYDASWQSLTAAERLEVMAESYKGLTANQKIFVSDLVAGKWQIAKWSQLMADVGSDTGYYKKALEATSNPAKVMRQYTEELNRVLESNPQKFKQAGQIIRNSFADVMIKLLPYIVFVAQKMAQLAQAFGNMNPYAQMATLGVLGFLLVFGPLLRYMGSSLTLFATMGDALRWLGRTFLGLGGSAAASAAAQAAAETAATQATVGGARTRTGILSRSAAQARTATASAWGSIVGITQRGVTAVVAAENARINASHATTSRWAAAQAAIHGRHASSTVGIHTAMWQALLAGQARHATVSNVATARHAATTRGAHAATGGSLVSIWAGVWSALGAQQGRHAATSTAASAGWAARMRAIQGTVLGTMIAAEHTFNTKRKASWTTAHAWIAGGEAGWAARMKSIQGAALGSMIMAEHAFNTKRKIGWQATQNWLLVGHSAWMTRMAGIARIGLSKHTATESAFFGVSRAKWAAYWTSLAAMQKGAAAKMVATDAAMKAKMSASGLLKRMPLMWIAAFVAVLAVIYNFRDEISEAFRSVVKWGMVTFAAWVPFFQRLNNKIVEAFYRLPKGVRDAMIAVVRIVQAAAMAVYKLFSYLNPFARHSPSLVDQVTRGMAEIKKQYAGVGDVGGVFAKAAADLKRFKDAAAALGRDEWAEQRKDVAEAFPSMLPAFNQLVGHLKSLNTLSAQQEAAVRNQEAVVSGWNRALKSANDSLDAQEDKLDSLKETLNELQDAYDGHKASMDAYANAPIQGMGAMEDQIFANEMAQKKLRLEMLRWEEANGSIDDIRNTLAMLQGDIEMARGTAADLRQAGAGSDILGPIEDEIRAMEEQYRATEQAMQNSPVEKMQDELARLAREGEMLELEKSLQFDPMIRQIEKLVNTQKELSYDEIVAGIKREQAAMAELEPQIRSATEAVKNQEQAVKDVKVARDALQDGYDIEKDKLQELQEEYRATEELIRNIESALNDLGSASQKSLADASKAAREASEGKMSIGDKFDALAGADLPDVGGQAGIGREGDVSDINALTEQLVNDTAKMFGSLDMLKPLKDAWSKVKDWWKNSAWPELRPLLGPLGTFIKETAKSWWDSMSDGKGLEWSGIKSKFEEFGGWLREKLISIKDGILGVWGLIGPDIKETFNQAWEAIKTSFGDIGAEIAKFGELWEPLKTSMGIIWGWIQVGFFTLAGVLIAGLTIAWSVLSETIGPIINFVSDTIENLIQIFRGVAQVILGIINTDFTLMMQGLGNIIAGGLDLIWDAFKNFGAILLGIVVGIVDGVFNLFQAMWDRMGTGARIAFSIVAGLVTTILLPTFVTMATQAAISAAKVVASWALTAAGAVTSATITVAQAAIHIAQWIKLQIAAVINAAKVAAAWVVTQAAAIKSATVAVAQVVIMVAQWVALQVAAAINAGKVAAAWVVTQAAAIKAATIAVAQVAIQVAQWILLSGKAAIHAARIAAAWLIAMGPIGWITLAVIALVALIVLKWDEIKVAIERGWKAVSDFWKSWWAEMKREMNVAWDWIKNTAGSVWDTVKSKWASVWSDIKATIKGPIDTIKGWISDLVGAIDKAKSAASNLNPFGGGKGGGFFGGFDFNFDFKWASGGKMPTGAGAGFTTNKPTALVGEGGRWPEYVIPTDPRYKKNAAALWGDLGVALGALQRTGGATRDVPMLAAGGVLGTVSARLDRAVNRQSSTIASNGAGRTEIHFHGDLSFPNVTGGDSAEEFIRNLETLVG